MVVVDIANKAAAAAVVQPKVVQPKRPRLALRPFHNRMIAAVMGIHCQTCLLPSI
jgi:hypothetical protein